MTRLCMIGFFAVLASGQAWPAALDGNNDRAACDQGDLAACTRIINDVVADAQDRVAAGITRGLLYSDRGEREQALADFRQAISLDPKNSPSSLRNRCFAVAKSDHKDRTVFAYAIGNSRPEVQQTVIGDCVYQALLRQSSLTCAVAELACDGLADLPAALRPEFNRACVIGEKVTVSGTIQDVAREWRAWSAGAIARTDHCRGLTDLSTGFAALFGEGKPPANCEHGSRFWATGTASSGFQPEFFLKVKSIRCE
jgi:hypothetical protein